MIRSQWLRLFDVHLFEEMRFKCSDQKEDLNNNKKGGKGRYRHVNQLLPLSIIAKDWEWERERARNKFVIYRRIETR